jgi:DNA-binding beta-propeller fold protein YncE
MPNKSLVKMIFKTGLAFLLTALAATTASRVAPVASAAGNWTNGQSADVVLGQADFTSSNSGTTSSTMNTLQGVAVDPTTGKVFVADNYNSRILRFSSASAAVSGSSAESVLGQADFTSGSPNRGGAVAANTIHHASGLFIDSGGRLWVADQGNNRVLRFDNASAKADGANADGVLGQADFLSNAANRGGTVAANTMKTPSAVWVDTAGRLWVDEYENHRVLRFDNAATKANGADADGVLGQTDFTSNTVATTQSGMNYPSGLVVTNSGVLFVVDHGNSRVLRFDDAATKLNGANADGVLGQADFTSNATATTQSGFTAPWGVAFEENGGRLHVSDSNNSRVLIFNNGVSKANGANADNVLGQTNQLYHRHAKHRRHLSEHVEQP